MHKNIKKRLVFAVVILLLPFSLFGNAANNGDASDHYNMALISLIALMLILLYVIGMLANTLRLLSFAVKDKIRKEKNITANITKAIMLFLLFCIPALHLRAAEVATNAAPTAITPVSNFISGIPKNDFYAIMTMISLEIMVIFALILFIKILLGVYTNKPEITPEVKAIAKTSWFWDKFNAAATIEQEKDVLLDHNYDGIQELDNSLPPWWKYGFYLTIIIAVTYLYRFHVSHDGPSQEEEYVAEMQKGEEEKAAYLALAANNIDENSVILLTDANEIANGKELFVKNCAPCHLADGGGIVGPNLTDEYWLHGGSVKDIFKSIKYGWQDKGMKSWKDDFTPKQIEQLASFVKSLRGTHPAVPKAPQGDLYIEATQGDKAIDSTKAIIDSSKTGKTAAK